MKSHLNDRNIEKLAKVKSELEKSESHYVGMGEEMPMELVGFSAFVGDESNKSENFLGLEKIFGGGSSKPVSEMTPEEAMASYDAGVKSGTLKADGTKVSTGKQVLDAVGGVGGAINLLGSVFGKGGQGGQVAPPPIEEKKPDNTMLYVGIGAGVLLLIVIIVVVMKNK